MNLQIRVVNIGMCVCSCVLSHFSCLTLCNLMDCSPPGSAIPGVFQARILEWVAMSSSRVSFWPRDWTGISCISKWILYHWATREALSSKLERLYSFPKTLCTFPLCIFKLTISFISNISPFIPVQTLDMAQVPLYWHLWDGNYFMLKRPEKISLFLQAAFPLLCFASSISFSPIEFTTSFNKIP